MSIEKDDYKIRERSRYKFIDFSEVVMMLSEISYRLLQDVYGNKEIKLPIVVDDVARELGITIYSKNLNLANSRKYNQRIGELNGNNIFIEETADWDVKRFAIAHEIGHYLIDRDMGPAQYSLPLLASNSDELLADVYALFLLVPFDLYLDEFKHYIDNIETLPININHWLKRLSVKAEVPYYNIASGYAYFKFVALEHYKTKIEGKPLRTQIEEYGELFY